MAPRRAAVAAAVVLGHVLLVLGWRMLTASIDASRRAVAPPQPALIVRLWTAPPEPTPARPTALAPDAAPRTAARPLRSESVATRPPPAALQVPQAAALPAPATGSAVTAPTMPATAEAQPAAEPASSPLRLDLPRSGVAGRATLPPRNPALDDPRAQSAAPTMASRIAKATAATWTEEPLGDGRIRFRRGDECFITVPSRDGGLDAFNQSVAPRMRGAGPC